MSDNYQLRAILDGHSSDVRAISVCENDIATGSRDRTAILWVISADRKNIRPGMQYLGHESYVTSICLVPPHGDNKEGFVVTGSKDSNIFVYPRSSAKNQYSLTGHTNTVSCLVWEKNFLISGSWDHSAIVWLNWEKQITLKGHMGPIWAVAILEFDSDSQPIVLTASADRTITMWKQGLEIKTFRGHSDCVRDLAVRNSEEFLSCSNDATIKLWNTNGDNLATLYGHTNFIYSLACINSRNIFITGGEDRTVRVWNSEGVNIQTIVLPGQSVWGVAALPNGDIIAASSDHKAYIFTNDSELQAGEELQKLFSEKLSKSKVMDDIGGIKKTDLSDSSVLLVPGKKDGQTTMVREDGKVFCYSWSESKQKWDKMGEVVGASGGSAETSGTVLYEGKQYDFVFEVDSDDGKKLKLPYDRSEDPWFVAQRFIDKHQLPQDYLQQVAEFIMTNAGVKSSPGLQGYNDPFTGGARYVPEGDSQQSNMPTTRAANKYFPQSTSLIFNAMNKAGLLNKLQESNGKVDDNKLHPNELMDLVESICSEDALLSEIEPLAKSIQWPVDHVWPALDALRLALRFNNVQVRWLNGDKGSRLLKLLINLLTGSVANVQMLCFRCLANLAVHQPGRELLNKNRNLLMNAIFGTVPFKNKNVEIGAATLLLNYCTMMLSEGSLDDKFEILGASAKFIIHSEDEEAIFRILVGVGTLLWSEDKVKSYAVSIDLKNIISGKINNLSDSVKVTECGKEINKML